MKRDRVRLFGEITKTVENDDGTVTVSGIASTETLDSQGESITAEAMKGAIPDYMAFGAVREMHQPIAAGTALSIEVGEDRVTRFEALVVDDGSVKKVNTKVLKAFSVGGYVPPGGRRKGKPNVIDKFVLTEISLVDRPANPDAVIELVKLDKEQDMKDEIKKGLYDVSRFADILMQLGWLTEDAAYESEWEGDSSAIPDQLRNWLVAGAEIFQAMAVEEVNELLARLKEKIPAPLIVEMAAPAGDVQKSETVAWAEGLIEKLTKRSEDWNQEDFERLWNEIDSAAKARGRGEDPLTKAGAKYSAATKAELKKAHDSIKAADQVMCGMKYDDVEEADQPAGDVVVKTDEPTPEPAPDPAPDVIAKAEHLAKVDELQKALDAEKARADELASRQASTGKLTAVAKGDDVETVVDPKPETEITEKDSSTDAVRKVHASGGQRWLGGMRVTE